MEGLSETLKQAIYSFDRTLAIENYQFNYNQIVKCYNKLLNLLNDMNLFVELPNNERIWHVEGYRMLKLLYNKQVIAIYSIYSGNIEVSRLYISGTDDDLMFYNMVGVADRSIDEYIISYNSVVRNYIDDYVRIPQTNYEIERLAPHRIKGPQDKYPQPAKLFKPNNLPYYRVRLGNKIYYWHQLVAIATQLPGYREILPKTRSKYYQLLKAGKLFVIDHIDNNPTNNNYYNLQIINQQENLAKRYK